MLSRDLLDIVEWLARVDDGGVPPPAALPRIRVHLCDCVERAAMLEQAVVPPAMRVTEADLASGKIVMLEGGRR